MSRLALPPLALACLLFNAFVGGVSWWPFRQLNALGLHSLWATGLAFLFSTLVITLWRPRAWLGLLRRPALWWLVLASGATNAAFNWGVMVGEVVRVVLLFYLMPVWSLLLARVLLRETVPPAALARVGMALAGALIVLWQPAIGLPLPGSLADWLGLVGGAAFAGVNVLVRRYRDSSDDTRALAMFFGGFVVATAIALAMSAAGRIAFVPAPTPLWVSGVAGLALVLLAANFGLQYGAARLPAAVTSIIMLSEVAFAAASSAWLSGERLDARTLIGGALILGATLSAALSRRTPAGAAANTGGSHS
ncbi:MAG: DMT family transporter [Burkholderiales bacterium]|nr:DMT family transporter [Burkholderiales bacterium]